MSIRQPTRLTDVSQLANAYPRELLVNYETGAFTIVKPDGLTIVHSKPGTLTVTRGSQTIMSATDLSGAVTLALPTSTPTADAFSVPQTVELTGDITGSASSAAGWTIATTLADNGVTSGDYGPAEDAEDISFTIPAITVDSTGRVTDISDKTITVKEMVGAASSEAGAAGLVPAPAVSEIDKFLKGDGTWATAYTHPSYTAQTSGLYKITVDALGHVSAVANVVKSDITALGIPGQDTTYDDFTGADGTSAGTSGLVPAPAATDNNKILSGAGTWVDRYTHPSYTAAASGLYKVTVDALGHVSNTVAVAKSDITALGIPAQDTTYSDFTGADGSAAGASGLVPAPAATDNNKFLKGDGTWATAYTHPSHTAYESGLYKVTVDALGHVSAATTVAKSDITALGIPAQDTTYDAENGITLSNGKFGHSNSVTAGTASGSATGTLDYGDTFDLPTVTYDAFGHITAKGTTSLTLPAAQTTITGNAGSATKLNTARNIGLSGVTATAASFDGTADATIAITAIPVSLLDGVIDISHIPEGALERLYIAANEAAMKALTAADVQNGDTVKNEETSLLYYVKDQTKLNDGTLDAFELYTAGAAASVPWSGVTGRPNFATVALTGSYNDLTNTPSVFTGTDGTDAGAAGFVPAPAVTDVNKILCGNGTWVDRYSHPTHTAQTSGLYKITVDALGHVSAVTAVAKSDITALGIPGQDTTYSDFTGADGSAAGAAGLVPAPAATDNNKFLKGDGTWAIAYTHPSYTAATSGLYKVTVDALGHVSAATAVTKSDITDLGIPAQDTTYSDFVGADGTNAGEAGLVPAPAATDNNKILSGAGTWIDQYSHPTYTAQASGLYKVTVDALGHVSAATAVAKSDITALGIPGQDTTYSDFTPATSSAAGAAGLVPAPAAGDENKLLTGGGTWVDQYTHPTYTSAASGMYKVSVDGTGHVSSAVAIEKSDITALGIPGQDTTYSNFVGTDGSDAGVAGLVPAPATTDAGKFLKSDGTWGEAGSSYVHPTHTPYTSGLYKVTVDDLGHVTNAIAVVKSDITALGIPGQDTTYSDFTGADGSTAGTAGLVPAPAATDNTKYLKGDGTWATVPTYTHPTHTSYASGLYKVTVDSLGHVSAATAVAKSDITALGIPSENTTYSNFVGANGSAAGTAGLVPAPAAADNVKFLKGDGTWSAVTLANSGVTAGSYGPSTNVSPGSGGTFTVPKFTVNSQGILTAAGSITVTMPTVPSTSSFLTVTGGTMTSGTLSTKALTVQSGSTLTVTTAGNVSGISVTYSASIAAGSWTGSAAPFTKTITVTGIKATDIPIVDVNLASITYANKSKVLTNWGSIYRIEVTAANTIKVYSDTAFTDVAVPIQLQVIR